MLRVGDQFEVFWPIDDQYYLGTITVYDQSAVLHNIRYEYGDKQKLNMKNETWCILRSHHIDVSDLSTIHEEALELYFKTFAKKEFMFHKAEGLPRNPVWNSFLAKEINFSKLSKKYQLPTFQKIRM